MVSSQTQFGSTTAMPDHSYPKRPQQRRALSILTAVRALARPGRSKQELGFSRRWSHWILDGYGGVWFFTTNSEFFSHNQFSPGTNTQSQAQRVPSKDTSATISSPGRGPSFDANFWFGGSTSLNGAINEATRQRNSQIGATASIPLSLGARQ
jgi:hypothetical protein